MSFLSNIGSKLVGSVGDIATGLIGGGFSALGTSQANKANVAMSREQMAFQERMSNTQYQRGMEDMRKAGLNPMLAYQQGGASSPMGASIPQIDELTPAVNSALSAKRLDQDLQNLKQSERTAKSSEKLNYALRKKALEEAKHTQASARNVQQINKINEPEVNRARETSQYRDSWMGKVTSKLNAVLKDIGITGSNFIKK